MSRGSELKITEYFIKRLAASNGYSYTAGSEDEEDDEVDTWITDQLGQMFPVQNVTSEGTTLRLMAESTRALREGKPLKAAEVNQLQWIRDVLALKESKHYSHVKNIVLLIRGSLPYPEPREVLTLLPIDSSFAGVYYVAPPSSSYPDGYVVRLKEFWVSPEVF